MANNDIKLSFGVNIRRTTQNLYSELNSVVEDVGTNLNGIEMHIDTKKINTEEIVNSINSMISQFEYSLTVSNIDVSPRLKVSILQLTQLILHQLSIPSKNFQRLRQLRLRILLI